MPRYDYTCDRGHVREQFGDLDENAKMCGASMSLPRVEGTIRESICTLLAKRAEVSTGTRFHVKSS